MDTLGIIFTVVLIIAAILAGMYFLGRYLQKKQNESQQLIDQNRQKITAYIIDKKKAKVSEANFPKSVMEQEADLERKVCEQDPGMAVESQSASQKE